MSYLKNKDWRLIHIVFTVVAALIIDMELSNVSDIISVQLSSSFGILIFIFVAMVYTLGQYFILNFSKKNTESVRRKNYYLSWTTKAVISVQYLLIALFVTIILQILLLERYSSVVLILILTISNGLSIFTMIILAQRLLSYFKWERDLIVFTYGISAIVLALTALITILFMGGVLLNKSLIVYPETEVSFPSIKPNSLASMMNYMYYVLAIVSFVSIWTGTVMLMNQYSKRMKDRRRIWLVMLLSLGFYLSQVAIIYLSPFFIANLSTSTSFLFYYRIIFTISSTIGGILFGIPFLQIAQKFKDTPIVKNYAIISASGLILFFVAGSATIYQTPYPPFGLATVALIGLSSYLILLGIHSLAISISEDDRLRRFMIKTARELRFLHSLGVAERGQEIEKRVAMFKINIIEDTGIEPSYNEDEMKQYLNQVLEEVQQKKKEEE